ncbi:hypothetical protein [Streptomyces sp. MZ04]|uniref:WD40 repeat domain-containing protein n=1 Tax=Streptomyces sp. MZ04 TaxID=2559236 RepID=UPI00107E6ABF|nr:hypothetical protein [Streptomyces sp. MZ04]TGB15885.1 hypothetical protein E2651_01800 [Streptomyces sp. MZ04]
MPVALRARNACDDETIKIWDTEAPPVDGPGWRTGLRDSSDSGQGTAARAASITPDGSRLVTLHPSNDLRIWAPHAESVTGWDAVSWEQNSRYRFHAVLALSPDCRYLAECQDSHRPTRADLASYAYVYDLAGTLEQQIFPRFGVTITTLAIAANRSRFVVGDMEGAVTFWDPTEESPAAHTRPGHTGRVTVATMALDGSWVATGGEDKKVKLWNMATRRATTLTGHTAPVTAIAVAPDGTWLATGGEDGTTRIWDRAGGACTAVLTGHTGRVTSLAITPDGGRIAVVTGSRTLHIWDRATGEALTLMRTEAPLLACAWTGDGHDLIACGSRGLYGYRFRPRGTATDPGSSG